MTCLEDDQPRQAVLDFLRSFEACDLAKMELAFAPQATHFDRAAPGATAETLRLGAGMPAGMRRLAETLPANRPGPPYHRLEPQDLRVHRSGAMAVCTFHLLGETIGRRTIVLQSLGGAWKILHIHASNVAVT